MSDDKEDRKDRSSEFIIGALGALALLVFAGVGIFALDRHWKASHPVVFEKGALCEDWVGEIGEQTTCPHREHFMVFQSGSYGNDPFMLCKCPAKKSAVTPGEVWLHPGDEITLRCSVTGTRLSSDWDSGAAKYWCEKSR